MVMTDLRFVIDKRVGKKAEGVLSWAEKRLQSRAVSGPYGDGALPLGIYTALRTKLLDRPAGSSYCDTNANCWMQAIDPTFTTSRTDLGIHPDGGAPGTEGCIGLLEGNTEKWHEAFYGGPNASSLEVLDAPSVIVFSDMAERRTIVTVVGSHNADPARDELAEMAGVWIASQGFDLLTGAGPGVMTSVARGFCRQAGRRGVSIGVVPGSIDGRPKSGYPNPWIEIPIF